MYDASAWTAGVIPEQRFGRECVISDRMRDAFGQRTCSECKPKPLVPSGWIADRWSTGREKEREGGGGEEEEEEGDGG